MRKLHNWDDWRDYFRFWQDSIGLERKALRDFDFDIKFGDPDESAIEFGHYKGQRKWPSLMHIPDQRIRDALMNLIIYQGDTEFASVEQQRNLLVKPPSDYDMQTILRVMCEEMRHGWQMSYLLCEHFGDEGRREAAKLLERNALEGQRLLGSFNEVIDNWLDFFTYAQFIDRDGKFQLKMLSTGAFEPLALSMGPMLKEESFHLGTGNNGLLRIIKAGRIPPELMQKFFNRWVPTAFDLFGTDQSSSAHWAYVWGLKGRFDERETERDADKGALNEASRGLYRDECVRLVQRLNRYISDPDRHLYIPDMKFNRSIGQYAHMRYDVKGNEMSQDTYERYFAEVTPSEADYAMLNDIMKDNDWIEHRASTN